MREIMVFLPNVDTRNYGSPTQEQNKKLWFPSLRSRMTGFEDDGVEDDVSQDKA